MLHAVGCGREFLAARGCRAAKARPPPGPGDPRRDAHHRSAHCAPAELFPAARAQRGKPVFTTIADPAAATPAELVDRRFTQPVVGGGHHLMGPAPGLATPRLSPTRPPKRPSAGRVAVTMRTEDLPLQAFNHAVWQADSDLSESAHHSDRGSPHCRRHPAATPALPFPNRCRCSRRASGGRPGDASQADPPNPTLSVVPHHNSSPSECCDDR